MKTLGVGIVGYGFIGRVHAYGYLNLPLFYQTLPVRVKLVGVCTAHLETAKKARDEIGFAVATTNYKELLKRDNIHIIDCCTPNFLHRDILMDSLRAGKHIYADKPLATNLKEAEQILNVAQESETVRQMAFEYRFIPAIMRARQLVEEKFLGKVFHFRMMYLHSGYVDSERPLSWRLDRKKAGGGALQDMGPHVIDLIRHLLGDVKAVNTVNKTFIGQRPLPGEPNKKAKVEVDDISLMQVEMKSGAVGTVEVSRLATGSNDELRIEIHGDSGALCFNLMDPNWLLVYDNKDPKDPIGGLRGFKKIETVQRYPEPVSLPGPKFSIGWMRYHIASQFDFIMRIAEGKQGNPNFHDGYKVQEVIEAAYQSAERGEWVKIFS